MMQPNATRATALLAVLILIAVPSAAVAQERAVIRSETTPQPSCRGACDRSVPDRSGTRAPGLSPSLDLRNREDAYGGGYRDGFRDGLRTGRRGWAPGARRSRGGGIPPIDPGRFTWVDGVPFLDVPAGAEYFDGPHFQYGGARTGRGVRCNRSGGHFHTDGGMLIVRWR